ncbi:Icc-related predicted phosphoesterase [Parabacteroides sp. PFB2-12]|nr:Icc-related predicted phosphoesterase [Parabacteroides sp. PM6-13]MDH6390555.1 Icc-related predicted phosphoesterase [Parabacteroides sp. PFB2-12]
MIKRFFTWIIMVLFVSLGLQAQQPTRTIPDVSPVLLVNDPLSIEETIFYAPPYLQNPVDGGITVMWQTHVPTYSWVEYGTDKEQLTVARTLVDGQVICNGLHNKIRINGLEPGKTYYYRVCSQEILLYQAYKKEFGATARSPFYTFRLPDEKETDFTALIFNDIHKREATLNGLYDLVKEIPYDFVFFNGDCIDDPATEEEALYHIAMQCKKVNASSHPVFYLRGNHEIRNAFSIGLRELFDYVGDKTYGAFSWGDTRFVMLDCGEDKPDSTWVYYGLNDFTGLRQEQVGFLQKELKNRAFKKAKKRVLINHIPLYTQSTREAFHPSRDLWEGLLKKAPFDVNISAHTHHHAYVAKGEDGNNFPVVIGGGNRLEEATVMVLQKKGKEMTLRVWNGKKELIYNIKL